MRSIILRIGGVILLAVFLPRAIRTVRENEEAHHEAAVKRSLTATVDQIRATLPRMIDKDTRWDDIDLESDRVLTARYTLVNYHRPRNFDRAAFEAPLRSKAADVYRDHPDLKRYRDLGFRFKRVYWDADGNELAAIEAGPGS